MWSEQTRLAGTPEMCARVTRAAMSAEQDHPQTGSWANSTLATRGVKQNSHEPPIDKLLGKFPTCHQGAKTLIKKPRSCGVHNFQGITEAGSRPLLRQLSCLHQGAAPHHIDLPWHRPLEDLPCWTGDFTCPAALLTPEILPCKTLKTPLPTVLSPGPAA